MERDRLSFNNVALSTPSHCFITIIIQSNTTKCLSKTKCSYLEDTVLVEVHQASTEVPVEAEGEDVEEDEDGQRGEEIVGSI